MVISKLYYDTVTPLLLSILKQLMETPEFSAFRLVGGTALSLQLGHRASVDLDLFTDAGYGSVDFERIDTYLKTHFAYYETFPFSVIGMGKSYYVGETSFSCIKIDMFYTDPFIRSIVERDGIRLADVEEILAMKIDVIQRGGRKKDFWDIHELLERYSIRDMFALHEERFPYTHDRQQIISNFTKFDHADDEYDPACFRNKYWEIIKLDIISAIRLL